MSKFKPFREVEDHIRLITPQEFAKLRAEQPAHVADMATFAVATGLRQPTWKNWSGARLILSATTRGFGETLTKNGRPRSIPLNKTALSSYIAQLGTHPTHVFTSTGIRSPICTKAFKAALVRIGIEDYHLHDLRHIRDMAPSSRHPRRKSCNGSAAERLAKWSSDTPISRPKQCRQP